MISKLGNCSSPNHDIPMKSNVVVNWNDIKNETVWQLFNVETEEPFTNQTYCTGPYSNQKYRYIFGNQLSFNDLHSDCQKLNAQIPVPKTEREPHTEYR